jgi:hypothetical protein
VHRQPFRQRGGHAVDDFLVALQEMCLDLAHGVEDRFVVAGVAVVGIEAGGDHPALFLREMLDRVPDQLAVGLELLGMRQGAQAGDLLDHFLMRLIHAPIAQLELGRPVQVGHDREFVRAGGLGVFHDAG